MLSDTLGFPKGPCNQNDAVNLLFQNYVLFCLGFVCLLVGFDLVDLFVCFPMISICCL